MSQFPVRQAVAQPQAAPPSDFVYTPPAPGMLNGSPPPLPPHSAYLADALAKMRQDGNSSQSAQQGGFAAATAGLPAATSGQGASGSGWLNDQGGASHNWFDSPIGRTITGQPQAPGQQPYVFGGALGKSIGGLFGLGQAAQTQQGLNTASQQIAANGVMPPAF